MRALRNKPNVNPPDSDYPFGRAKDNPGDNSGTHVDELLLGDILQFFEKLGLDAGVAFNNLPENSYSGFQLNQALAGIWNDISATLNAGWSQVGGSNTFSWKKSPAGSSIQFKGYLTKAALTGTIFTICPTPAALTAVLSGKVISLPCLVTIGAAVIIPGFIVINGFAAFNISFCTDAAHSLSSDTPFVNFDGLSFGY